MVPIFKHTHTHTYTGETYSLIGSPELQCCRWFTCRRHKDVHNQIHMWAHTNTIYCIQMHGCANINRYFSPFSLSLFSIAHTHMRTRTLHTQTVDCGSTTTQYDAAMWGPSGRERTDNPQWCITPTLVWIRVVVFSGRRYFVDFPCPEILY